ncbi:hypothetical protein DXG03_001074 [Asterophora parasitica]|uniref:Uncharacterized protein n=1 Tax=Asterophora parasitica TaxID=117018 RepID=A0A9P7KD08_9AGAR|nr:hypothetical protein DXG03_001074 [Asterophora parasitica]
MPPRPSPISRKHTTNRISAVYIGSPGLSSSSPFTSPPLIGSPSHIPELPGPPSPGSSPGGSPHLHNPHHSSSGLPSPPATNSTGSGSDLANVDDKERPLSFRPGERANNILEERLPEDQEQHGYDQDEHEDAHDGRLTQDDRLHNDRLHNDDEGDDTARFELHRSYTTAGTGGTNENAAALQRVKSLTLRTRMTLDKLSSYPRSGTPSRTSTASGSSSHSASRLSGSMRRPSTAPNSNLVSSTSSSNTVTQFDASTSQVDRYDPRSGSETERESVHTHHSHSSHSSGHHSSHSHDSRNSRVSGSNHHRTISYADPPLHSTPRAFSPPSNINHTGAGTYRRTRVPSAPSSPVRARNNVAKATNSPSRRRKRVSLASSANDYDEDEGDGYAGRTLGDGTARGTTRERDLIGSARRRGSPTPNETPLSGGLSARRRGALPFEFRSPDPNTYPMDRDPEPQTPLRAPKMAYTTSSSSSATASSSAAPPPSAATTSRLRSSTVRPYSRSTDLTSTSRRTMTPVLGMGEYRERKQSMRGGSADSALAGYEEGRTSGRGAGRLVGEGLRAAGLSPSKRRSQRFSLQGESARRADRDRDGWGSDEDVDDGGGERRDGGRRRADTLRGGGGGGGRDGERNRAPGPRAATSMADYRYLGREREEDERNEDEQEEHDRRGVLRNSKSAVGPLRTRERDEVTRDRDRDYIRDRDRDTDRDRDRERDRDRDRDRSLARDRDRSLARDREFDPPDRDRAPSALSRYGTFTRAHVHEQQTHTQTPSGGGGGSRDSPFGSRRVGAPPPTTPHQHTQQPPNQAHAQSLEHTRLMVESLAMFEAQLARASASASSSSWTPLATPEVEHLIKGAQGIVGAAERLNEMLRWAVTRAVEAQVGAEVETASGPSTGGRTQGREMETVSDVWGRVGAEYREGLRVSDELVRGLTGFLLGVGKTVRDLAGAEGGGGDRGLIGSGSGGVVHGRSVSLDEEGLGLMGRRRAGSASPDVVLLSNGGGSSSHLSDRRGPGSSGGGSGSDRRSVESRSSWDLLRGDAPLSRDSLRDDVSRRLVARAESALGGARPPSAFASTLRDRDRDRLADARFETPSPPTASGSRGLTASASTGSTRRLFTPREQREMQAQQQGGVAHQMAPGGMPTIHSQETLYGEYEPSPTPASRVNHTTLDRSRTLPPLGIPKPLPSLPSESSLRRNQTVTDKHTNTVRDRDSDRDRDRTRHKPAVASISTVRGTPTTSSNAIHTSSSASATSSSFPASLTTPSNATTALTPHTVSTTPDRTAFPSLPRTDSDRSIRSTVTFSRPSTISVSALNGLQQQDLQQRRRAGSNASAGAEPSTSMPPPPVPTPSRAPAAPQMQRVLSAQSGSETERPLPKRQTLGRMGRMSLDNERDISGAAASKTVHAADRSAAIAALGINGGGGGGGGGGGMLPPMNTAGRQRQRRRTVTEIWPPAQET